MDFEKMRKIRSAIIDSPDCTMSPEECKRFFDMRVVKNNIRSRLEEVFMLASKLLDDG